MRWGLLLRSTVGKELRTLRRERQQLLGILIGLLSTATAVVAMEGISRMERRRHASSEPGALAQPEPGDAATTPAPPPEPQAAPESPPEAAPPPPAGPPGPLAVRWSVILGGALISLYASFFAASLALASFVGEKEAQTLEVTLATPLPDRVLYLAKVLGVFIPGSMLGYALYLVAGAYILIVHPELVHPVPSLLILESVLAALPLPAILTGLQVGACAIVSVRADTMAGAGQAFGGCILAVMFGGAGIGFAIAATPLKVHFTTFGCWWIGLPFLPQYAMALGALVAICLGLLALGMALFRRERLLT